MAPYDVYESDDTGSSSSGSGTDSNQNEASASPSSSSTSSHEVYPSTSGTASNCRQSHGVEPMELDDRDYQSLAYGMSLAGTRIRNAVELGFTRVLTPEGLDDATDFINAPPEHTYAFRSRMLAREPEIDPMYDFMLAEWDYFGMFGTDAIFPLNMHDWSMENLHPALEGSVQRQQTILEEINKIESDNYLGGRGHELPKEPPYNPNKSRLRKNYSSAEEQQERARNNNASRDSRYKKKYALQYLNLQKQFQRQQNYRHEVMLNFFEFLAYWLEGKCVAAGIDVSAIRTACGFSQRPYPY